MRYLPIIICITTLIGCGNGQNKKFWIEPRMQSYYDSFIAEAQLRSKLWDVDDLEIHFANDLGMSDATTTILGTCSYDEDGTPVVKIDEGEFGALGFRDFVGFEAAAEDLGGFEVVERFGGIDLLKDAVDDPLIFDAADFEVGAFDGGFDLIAEVANDFVGGIFNLDPGGAAFEVELF